MKKTLVIVLVIIMLFAFTACSIITKFKYAYITLPNGGVVEVEVDDYVIGTGNVKIIAKDGRRYLVSTVNCLLTTDRLDEVEE